MFHPPGSSEMMRVVHEVEIAEARRRARRHREARRRLTIRQAIGRALIAIGLLMSGGRPLNLGVQDEPIARRSAPSVPRSASVDRGC